MVPAKSDQLHREALVKEVLVVPHKLCSVVLVSSKHHWLATIIRREQGTWLQSMPPIGLVFPVGSFACCPPPSRLPCLAVLTMLQE